ncbi:lycopene cyclase domain-containing protein [Frondihabitans peucedani]|uniref:Lycopene cyclase domain-containing protein n=1 Tax=Frondihabitans peucedani TaxID=598626 RepID=A0ABP8E571_9MICO
MTYWGLNAVFLAVVAVVGIAAVVVHGRRSAGSSPDRRRRARLATVLVAAILLGMTAVFDNVMIGIGLVGYDASKISGVFVGIAPLEDFSYAVAALILLPSLWVLLGGRRNGAGRDRAGHDAVGRDSAGERA